MMRRRPMPAGDPGSLQDACIPGFKTFVDPGQPFWLKLCWFILYLSFTSLTVVQLTIRFRHYFAYPVTLTYELKQFHSLRFPRVSVCGYLNTLQDSEFWQIPAETSSVSGNKSNLGRASDQPGRNGHHRDRSSTSSRSRRDPNAEHYSELVGGCEYSRGKSCDKDSLWQAIDTTVGRCFTLTLMDEFHNVGPSSGIKLLMKDHIGNATQSIFPQNKWQIMIHKDIKDATYKFPMNAVLISDKLVTSIVYTQKMFVYKNVPNRLCYSKEVTDECLEKYMNSEYVQKLQCRLPFMKTEDHLWRPCGKKERDAFLKIRSMDLNEMIYSSNCGRTCRETIFELQVDTRVERNSQAVVYIFPTREEVEVLKEKSAFTFYALVCEVGGTLGLYLGACLLTFVEIFDSALSILWARLSKYFSRSGRPQPRTVVIKVTPYSIPYRGDSDNTLRSVKFRAVSP